MGDGDKSDPTTDFFDTTLAQVTLYASKLRATPQAATLVAKFDEVAAQCTAAIAAGRNRTDMPLAVANLPQMVAKHEALSPAVKSALAAAIAADVVPQHP